MEYMQKPGGFKHLETQIILFFFWNPICIGMKTQFVLNNKNFILRVIKGNKFNASHPGYCCQCDEISGAICICN
jgi:hypothetical protein